MASWQKLKKFCGDKSLKDYGLKRGDENAKKKIHKMTNYRRNYWDKVRVNSVSFSEEADIKDGWLTYQKNNK